MYQNCQGGQWFQAEASLHLQTCSPKMNKDVHFWVRMAVKLTRSEICASHKSRRQNAQGWAGNKSETSFGTKLVLYRCTWTYNCSTPHTKQNLKHSKPAIPGQDAEPFSVTIVLFTQPRFFFIKIAFCIEGFVMIMLIFVMIMLIFVMIMRNYNGYLVIAI